MLVLDDVARFGPADAEQSVAASFACPYCLRAPNWVSLAEEPTDCAKCRCTGCAASWMVLLDPWQALRVRLAPPAALRLVADRRWQDTDAGPA